MDGGDTVMDANAMLSAGRTDWAIELYKRALEDRPENYQAEIGLAKAYEKKGMQKEAADAKAKAARMQTEEATPQEVPR